MKKSIVKNVSYIGTWNSPHGLYFVWKVEFENGSICKNPTKYKEPIFKVGEEVNYEMTIWGNKIWATKIDIFAHPIYPK